MDAHDERDAGKSTRPVAVVLDAPASAIIEQLREDGRRPFTRIANAVGLSEAAVRQRVEQLLDAGVVHIVAVADPLALGFERMAMVGVRVRGDLRAVADRVASLPGIDRVVLTAASFDLLCEIVCEDDDALVALVDTIRAVPGVRGTETFTYQQLAGDDPRSRIRRWATAPSRRRSQG